MKIKPRLSEEANTIIVVLMLCIITSIFLASYLKLTSNSVYAMARSSAWNQAIFVAEAGVEEALTDLENVKVSGLGGVGWELSNNEYFKTNSLGDKSYYQVKVSNNSSTPVITSEGYYYNSIQDTYVKRTVQVPTSKDALFTKALVAKGAIDINGNNIVTDSFDSSDPSYSTGGMYDPTKIKANGDVATNLDLIDSIDVGNANIKGHISTGPGGTVSIGPNGAVGDLGWHNGGNTGIQTGYFSDDMNVSFPDVEAPFSGGAFTPISGVLGGETYAYLLAGGDYQMSSLSMSSDKTMYVAADSVLYVTGNFSMTGSSQIILAPGVTFKVYVGGSTASLGGSGVVNPGTAENFFFYGLNTLTDMSIAGNGEFTGVIYAPYADVSMNGGGHGDNDFIGAGIFNSITMNGHYKFHYDEHLEDIGDSRGYIIQGWDEL